jgi:hypothetical protein
MSAVQPRGCLTVPTIFACRAADVHHRDPAQARRLVGDIRKAVLHHDVDVEVGPARLQRRDDCRIDGFEMSITVSRFEYDAVTCA